MTRNAPTIRTNAATSITATPTNPAPAAPNSFVAITDNIAIKEVNGTTVIRIGRGGPLDKYAVWVEEVNNDLGQLRITRSEEFKFEGEDEKVEGGLFSKFCSFLQLKCGNMEGMGEDARDEAVKESDENAKVEDAKVESGMGEGNEVEGNEVKGGETKAGWLEKLDDYLSSPFTWTEIGASVLIYILLGLGFIAVIQNSPCGLSRTC